MKLSLLKFVARHFLRASAVDAILYQFGVIPRLTLYAGPSGQKRRPLRTDSDQTQFARFTQYFNTRTQL